MERGGGAKYIHFLLSTCTGVKRHHYAILSTVRYIYIYIGISISGADLLIRVGSRGGPERKIARVGEEKKLGGNIKR